ncbi:MAG: hypothetical protein AAFS10_27400 [Myxococcota bacterium]
MWGALSRWNAESVHKPVVVRMGWWTWSLGIVVGGVVVLGLPMNQGVVLLARVLDSGEPQPMVHEPCA